MRKLFMMLVCIIFAATQLYAQNRTVTGKVSDDKGDPIPNASVTVKGTKQGTTTNAEGYFTLSGVPASVKSLSISSLNFVTREVAIGANNTIVASLASSSADLLDEVVVVGYGTAKRKRDVAGALTVVSAKNVQNRPAANVLDALQGQVAGLQVYTSSGEPTATPSVRLNGVSSLGSSSTPLYVMDGIPMESGTFLSLNPEDFESITVLKDASSTAIYGARAAAGVILVTTKKGRLNSSRISVSTQYGVSNLTNNAVNLYESFMNTKELTDFQLATGQFTAAQVAARVAAGYTADTKWYTRYYKQNAPTFQTDVNISGGGGKTTYYISGSYFKQDGLAYRSGYKRYTMRSNLATTVNNWFKMGANLFVGYDERQSNAYATNSRNGGLALLAQPYYSPVDANGVEYYNTLVPGLGLYSPKTLADYNQNPSNNFQFNPSGYIEINPFKGATLRSQGGFEFYDFRSTAIRLPSYAGAPNSGTASESFTRGTTRTITNTAEYKFDLGNGIHNINLLAGQEFINNTTSAFAGASTGLTDDRLLTVSAGPTGYTASSSKSEYAFLSYFGRINYNYDTKYFLDLSIRNDNSSKYGRDLRGAMFYSAGLLWKAKKERFLENVKWLTDLDVKVSYGTVGNSSGVGNYSALASVGTNTYNSGTGFGISASGNPLLSWEKVRKANFSLIGKLWNKLGVELEFYDNQTSDMIINVPYPLTSGFSSVLTNVGSLNNRGISVSLDYNIINTRNASLNINTRFNYTKEKVTELFQGKTNYSIANTGIGWVVGQPVTFLYPIFHQINPTTGLPEWFLPNSDPKLAPETTTKNPANVTSTFNSAALLQNTGIKRYAPFSGGFGLNGSFHQFTLAADFTFAQGKYMINNDQYFFENPNQFAGYNQSRNVLNYWKQPGDIATYPKYGVQFTQFDSRLIQNASFMRLKNLTIGYNVSKSLLNRTKVLNSANFYMTFRNIWTLTKYKGPDPEVDSNLGLGTNPNTNQVAIGLKLGF